MSRRSPVASRIDEPAAAPLPSGFRVVLDPGAKPLPAGGWFGGTPGVVMRLTDAGRAAWDELCAGPVASNRAGALGRRLTDGGIAHPLPPPLPGRPDVTVIIPVHDRADAFARCLASLEATYRVVIVDDASQNRDAIRDIAIAHGARLVRLERNVGPAGARNAGLAEVDTEFVAFVDSDTVPGHEWIAALAAHFADDSIAAVAPRIVARADGSFAGRYTQARCNLDLGNQPARVVPYGKVSYVPTAALLARRSALITVATPQGVFDPALRVGEDVDLIWRLHERGWRVRYDPSHRIPHHEPGSWSALLCRRHLYGTSTPMLARRHPDAMAPLVLYPWTVAATAALAARNPLAALATLAIGVRLLRRTLRGAGLREEELPTPALAKAVVEGVGRTWLAVGRYAVQFAAPVLLAGLLHQRTRLLAAGLALAPPLAEWTRRRPPLDPARFLLGYFADELSYGAGVLAQCRAERTVVPLRPKFVRRGS